MKILGLSTLLLMFFSTSGLKAQEYKTSADGFRYKIYKDVAGRNASTGDIIVFNFALATEDSTLFNTFDHEAPITIQIEEPKFKGDFMGALSILSEGDSGSLWISTDSMKKYTPMDPTIKLGSWMRYDIKVEGLYSPEEFKKKEIAEAKQQNAKDSVLINDYLKKNKLKAQKTASGLYYIIEEKGKGENAKPGQKVFVHYTGTLLDGKKFDSSRDRGQPFSFMLGKRQVIQGWDEGIALLNKGAKAKLLIPSSLGYGAQGGGPIPPNAVLIFDVELIDMQ